MIRVIITAAAAMIVLGEGPTAALAGAAPEEAATTLYERGYRHIQIDPDERPGYLAWACKGRDHYRVELDAERNILGEERVGDCDAKKGPKKVHVKAPFVDVQVGPGVRVRAPFVDIRIR